VRISGGISEINIGRVTGFPGEKIFVWPVYNSDGRVNSVYRVTARSGAPDIYYRKADDILKRRIIDSVNKPYEFEYQKSGSVNAKISFQPGSLFEALV